MFTHIVRLLAALMLLVCMSANAVIITKTVNMTNALEEPLTPGIDQPLLTGPGVAGDPRPASFGTATFTLNTDTPGAPFMTFSATVFNIDFTGTQTPFPNDNLIAAHIHAAQNLSATGTAPVVWGFFGMPFNDTLNNDPAHVLSLNDCTPFATGVGGTCSGTWDAPEGNGTNLPAVLLQTSNFTSGFAYINFHTTQFSGGEIRGFLVAGVPEPGAIALLALGLVLLTLQRRMQRS
jgi:hypothetical protein